MLKDDWKLRAEHLINLIEQRASGLAYIGGDYPEPREQLISLFADLLTQLEREVMGMKQELPVIKWKDEHNVNVQKATYNQAVDDCMNLIKKYRK